MPQWQFWTWVFFTYWWKMGMSFFTVLILLIWGVFSVITSIIFYSIFFLYHFFMAAPGKFLCSRQWGVQCLHRRSTNNQQTLFIKTEITWIWVENGRFSIRPPLWPIKTHYRCLKQMLTGKSYISLKYNLIKCPLHWRTVCKNKTCIAL